MKCMHVYVLHTFFGIVCIYADDIAISGDIIYIYIYPCTQVGSSYLQSQSLFKQNKSSKPPNFI